MISMLRHIAAQRTIFRATTIVALSLANLAGCRPKLAPAAKVPTYPVHGRLLIDGEPASGAMIKFIAQDQAGRVPTAIVRSNGTFSASYYDNEDGAPAGEFKLLVVWMQTPPEGGLAQDRLHGRFLDPHKPVATITVGEGTNFLAPIELNTGKLP